MGWGYFGFRPYVSVGQRRLNAQREMAKLAKKGLVVRPVQIEGRTIARTFWGKAWCDNLESYMDYASRLPRGRTYVRNGSVVHLEVRPGEIEARVSGSELYRVRIQITPAARPKWKALCSECAGGIGSLVELLQGRFSDHVMGILTRKETGLFPAPREIKLECSCPDWASMCKHVAAVLYGVGARLDERPELLFVLRSVKHEELVTQATSVTALAGKAADEPALAESELADVFGIELDQAPANSAPVAAIDSAGPASAAKPEPEVSRPKPSRSAKGKPSARRRKPLAKAAGKPVVVATTADSASSPSRRPARRQRTRRPAA